jgi:hypothetical protein
MMLAIGAAETGERNCDVERLKLLVEIIESNVVVALGRKFIQISAGLSCCDTQMVIIEFFARSFR